MTDTRFTVTQEAIALAREAVRYAGASASTASVQAAVREAEHNLDQFSEELADTTDD